MKYPAALVRAMVMACLQPQPAARGQSSGGCDWLPGAANGAQLPAGGGVRLHSSVAQRSPLAPEWADSTRRLTSDVSG